MVIKIDSREQLAYQFSGPSETGKLDVGDYSIVGCQDLVAIERKSIDDLIGSLSSGRERFEKELFRAKSLDYFCIVAECSLSDIAQGRYTSNMLPKAAIQSLLAFSIRYRLPIFFCENRSYGQRITESLLCKYARELQKQYEAIG